MKSKRNELDSNWLRSEYMLDWLKNLFGFKKKEPVIETPIQNQSYYQLERQAHETYVSPNREYKSEPTSRRENDDDSSDLITGIVVGVAIEEALSGSSDTSSNSSDSSSGSDWSGSGGDFSGGGSSGEW